MDNIIRFPTDAAATRSMRKAPKSMAEVHEETDEQPLNEEELDETLEETFPASDPMPMNPGSDR